MKWIVGLGNPGRQYAKTRHNIGFMAVDLLAEQFGISFNQNKDHALVGEGFVSGEKIVLLKPQTYMNLSGQAVKAYMNFYKIDLQDLIVLYDDLDIELGKMRLRYKGSAGGHNGIKSLIQHLGTQDFNRIRLGISRPPAGYDTADYVLSKFTRAEKNVLSDVLHRAVEAITYALDHPFEQVMARFNSQA